MISNILFSSKSDEWSTPQALFDTLNEEFHFTLDPCATDENAKCKMYYTISENGLEKSWTGHCVFCNPPYSQIQKWVKKSAEEARKGATVVMLIPSRTDTRWFHDYIYNKAEIRFIKGRVRFGESKTGAPFPSMIVVFERREQDGRFNQPAGGDRSDVRIAEESISGTSADCGKMS